MIPKVIHRIVGFGNNQGFNEQLQSLELQNPDFKIIDWSEDQIIDLMNDVELKIFQSYKKLIQKIDYARYIVLKYNGGFYCDTDVTFHKPIIDIYECSNYSDTFFEETTIDNEFRELTKSYKIRNGNPESLLRICSYVLLFDKFSINIQGILDICEERYKLEVSEEYDIIYTTGPDTLSEYFDRNDGLNFMSKDICDLHFSHKALGRWRFSNSNI
jgi:hypothetical protein